ncbi:MAG TPA: hypothetical protein VGQ46_23370 [Thermoanaerobaculia bacterium]|jgi:hypothetical protein|nr:hypothetical protein [Thermoanaerobaculia bacterium]
MSDDVRESLASQRDDRIARAGQRLVSGDAASEVQPDLDEIETYSRILDAMGPKKRRTNWIVPAVVAFVCVTVAGVLWSVKVPRTSISMAAQTGTMRFLLAQPWHIENAFHSPLMHFERLSTIQAPNLGLSLNEKSTDAWFELRGGTVNLEMLDIGRGARVEINNDLGEMDIYASGARLSGKLTVLGNVTVIAGPRAGETSVSTSYQLEIPETVEFAVLKPQRIASQVSVHQPAAWALGRLSAEELDFEREEVRGAGERSLTSEVKSGTLRFDDTSWPALELREGDVVGIRPTESAVLMTRGADHAIHVTLSGLVSSIRVGDAASQRNLAPSYLEYLYGQKSLGFFWGAIVFLWGFIWSVRNTVFR